tara:strand:- start:171 stop:380 length:210 start_codon:yes stop_codon:yes gene_type:complete
MPINVEVTLEECRGDQARLIKKFIKKVKKEKIIEHYLEGRVYKKPSEKRRLKRARRKQAIKSAQAKSRR